MTVLGRGLVFQPVLVTQTCTYNGKNITLTLQIFHQKKKKQKKKERKKEKNLFQKEHNNPPSPPPPNATTTTTKEATILENVLTCH